nr:hypothetical protein [Tanacetum cinerariifolium]
MDDWIEPSDENFKFDIESLPSRPFTLSEQFGALSVAHLNGCLTFSNYRANEQMFPIELTKLPLLEKLYLDKNKLLTLPSEVGDLKNLKVLTADCKSAIGLGTRAMSELRILRLFGTTMDDWIEPSDENFKFDIESLPSRPLALSEQFGVLSVAHLNGENTNYVIRKLIIYCCVDSLYLDKNTLLTLPSDVGDLKNLKVLTVDCKSATYWSRYQLN